MSSVLSLEHQQEYTPPDSLEHLVPIVPSPSLEGSLLLLVSSSKKVVLPSLENIVTIPVPLVCYQ